MNKKLIILLLMAAAAAPTSAQRLTVIKGNVDCGSTGYRQPVTAEFELRNKGLRKLRIQQVRTSCGCTSVDYPRQDIGANDKFTIRLTYDAAQLGHFQKEAAVYSNGSKNPIYLTMRGVVQAEVQNFSGTYPYEMGDLRIDGQSIEFDDVNKGDRPVQELHIYNSGTTTYRPNLMHLPAYLSATVQPATVAPGHAATITVTLHSDRLRDYGLTQTAVYLAANPGEKVSKEKEIPVSAVLLPGFIGLNDAQRQLAPKVQLSADTLNIAFAGKQKKTETIDIVNNGRTDLKISSLQMFTLGLKVTLGKRVLAPGESTKLKVTALRDELRNVRTRPRVLMITNDPDRPKIVININAK
ncbi:MAG: DUF1573 domain-containing protein [Prevotella sp.]|nr:DUF1573 domain-containing protein [Prevotella sp.]